MINDDVQYPNFRILYKFNLEPLNSKHAFCIKCNAQLPRSNSEGKTQNSSVFKMKYPNSNIFQHKGKHSVKKMGRFSLFMYGLLVFLKFSQPKTFFHSRLIKFRVSWWWSIFRKSSVGVDDDGHPVLCLYESKHPKIQVCIVFQKYFNQRLETAVFTGCKRPHF